MEPSRTVGSVGQAGNAKRWKHHNCFRFFLSSLHHVRVPLFLSASSLEGSSYVIDACFFCILRLCKGAQSFNTSGKEASFIQPHWTSTFGVFARVGKERQKQLLFPCTNILPLMAPNQGHLRLWRTLLTMSGSDFCPRLFHGSSGNPRKWVER